MKKILVGVTDAPSSDSAVKFAAQLAGPTESRLLLAYVSPPPARSFLRARPPEEYAGMEKFHAEELLEAAQRLAKTECTLIHRTGDRLDEMVELAAREEVWLSIAGAHRRTGLSRRTYVGFAHQLARSNRGSTLVTHGDPEEMHLAALPGRKEPCYVIGMDGSPQSTAALREAARLARMTGAFLHVLSVIEPVFVAEGFAPARGLALGLQAHAEEVLRHAKDVIGPGTLTHFTTSVGGAAQELEETARAKNASLIVVGDRGRGAAGRLFFGSTADRLINVAERPVWIVRS